MTMVKCNGCGLRINDILFQGTVHEGCAQHGRFIEHGDREARDKAFEQRVAMSQQAVMQGQNLYTQAGWNQMQANQQQYQDSPTMVLSGLRKHISELEEKYASSMHLHEKARARIAELEAMMHPETGDYVQNKIDAYVEAATMRITQLQNKIDAYVEAGAELEETRTELHRRANSLSDECGALKTENTQLLAENARLRRGGR
jgi:chromosome segregation ATPase